MSEGAILHNLETPQPLSLNKDFEMGAALSVLHFTVLDDGFWPTVCIETTGFINCVVIIDCVYIVQKKDVWIYCCQDVMLYLYLGFSRPCAR